MVATKYSMLPRCPRGILKISQRRDLERGEQVVQALECIVTNAETQCSNGAKIAHEGLFKIALGSDISYVVFQHTVGLKIICDGNMFQTFVWGNTATSIWSTDSSEITCLTLRDVYLDVCGSLYVLTSKPSPQICDIINQSPVYPSSILFVTPEQRFSGKLRNIVTLSNQYQG